MTSRRNTIVFFCCSTSSASSLQSLYPQQGQAFQAPNVEEPHVEPSSSSSTSQLLLQHVPMISNPSQNKLTNQEQLSGQFKRNNQLVHTCGEATNSSRTSTTPSQHHQARLPVTLQDMSKYFKASQMIAARMLGVSVSTLKRRYKDVSKGERWPYSKMSTNEKKRSLWFYINDEDEDEKALSQECLLVLQKAFKNCTHSTKYYFSDLSFPTNKKNKSSITIVKYTPPNSTQ
ncbi:hypothetical protein C9374_006296 [Naegleria lovaniensis]|uniref:RWP-RK domain-containing protein n=1 Tax=Naegleria lovaniensis TaxID=51637 RepID=A0AA88GN12_NAELO|nr:uncharacterized protein C9374_006296 [Naegleria lovaniensis]KAG2381307.1 hypothetical protein C9374_006296 [Naegleria lovaniensis]